MADVLVTLSLSKGSLIPYLMAGDPDLETTSLILRELAQTNIAAIELGIPYGDPLADGPTIAAAGQRALAAGTGIAQTLELLSEQSAALPPVILFTYFNPVYKYGLMRFAQDAAKAGAAGAIVPDVSLEESAPLREALASQNLCMPLLVAPSTPIDRAARIAELSTGFVYVVSRLGVTGAGNSPDFAPVRAQLAALRAVTDKPLGLGFGISEREHVDRVRDCTDAAIVGSALIDSYAGTRGEEAAKRVRRFVESLLPPR